jgi:aspartate-semialdehyde dehydrogenase
MTPVYKIAIAGASTLVGRELKDALSESPLAAANFVLLDEEEAEGQLDQVGDEITFVQAIAPDAFERMDFTFFCGSEDLTRKHWREALRAGSTVLDLSGALDQETGVVVRAPLLDSEAAASGFVYPRRGSGAPRGAGAGPGAGTLADRPPRCAALSPRCCNRPASLAAPRWTNCISRL